MRLSADDADFIDHLVTAVTAGRQILVDDIDESIDTRLHNLLNGSLISKTFPSKSFNFGFSFSEKEKKKTNKK